jgi:hypothetical protein
MIYTLENIYGESLKDNPVWTSKILRGSRWKQFLLRKEISVQLSNGEVLNIPFGFDWDKSSVPRIFWAILPNDGDFIIGALIHDYLYQNKDKTISWFNGDSKAARKFADKEMLNWSNKVNGTVKISLMKIDNYLRYRFVRWFGGIAAWNNDNK